MKLLRLLLAFTWIAQPVAAEEEALPDWMNTKIQIDVRKVKPNPETIADHVALVKAALKEKTGNPVQLEFSKDTLVARTQVGRESLKEMSAREYLEMILKEAHISRMIWEKSGEKGVKFVDVYLRSFRLYVEHQRKLEKEGPLSPERLAEMLKQQDTPASKYCRIIWAEESRVIMVVGLPADHDAMEKLLKRIPGWIDS